MKFSEITTTKPKTPEQIQADALKAKADKAASNLKLRKQQLRLSSIQKSFAKIQNARS